MKIFDLYGIKIQDGKESARLLEDILNVQFQPHQSDFWGDYFIANNENKGNYRLIQNFYAGEWHQENHKECPWLLEINDLESFDFLFSILIKKQEVKFLSRSEIESKKWMRRYLYEDGKFQIIEEVKIK
ncbi:hypothetical protein GCM10007860_24920 [Chitiniphilus shinanonensis]|uniref:Uncharacterized protein n=1 Tax=Chitiniphilus shinanonensis TaxID=553088 RepID=A0ABQ6BVG3_9NEIS|nr:hypothetical protein [Chitiniphilus shinanonensis]GLS05341.1 hypothetical protein GCM10007860_24920 [Chitiniphilus shinanonensis]